MTNLCFANRKKFLLLSGLALILARFFLQWKVPVIGDEAYYFYWGDHFAGGYYDLPPMIGWWEAFFSRFSHHPFWLRFPNFLSLALVVGVMADWLKGYVSQARAWTIAGLFAFSPLPFLGIMIAPDVPLMLFLFLSTFLFFKATEKKHHRLKLATSGALWGAAFLSKYFAVFLLPVFLIWLWRQSQGLKSFLGRSVLFTLGALPFLAQHLFWNAEHCWANFVFNLVTRQNADDGSYFQIIGLFLAYLLVHITPVFWGDALSWIRGQGITRDEQGHASTKDLRKFLNLAWAVPMLIFAITVALKKGQGLHWYISFTPFFIMSIALRLDDERLKKRLKAMMILASILSAALVMVLLFPAQTIGSRLEVRHPLWAKVAFQGEQWADQILPELEGVRAVFGEGYSHSSVLAFELNRAYERSSVVSALPLINSWGGGSRFGRVYDWTLRWSELEGKTVAIVSEGELSQSWAKYFQSMIVIPHQLKSSNGSVTHSTTYFVTRGEGFLAERYFKEQVLPQLLQFYPKETVGECSLHSDR